MLTAILCLGGIGLVAAATLGVASKKFAVEVDPREAAVMELCQEPTVVPVENQVARATPRAWLKADWLLIFVLLVAAIPFRLLPTFLELKLLQQPLKWLSSCVRAITTRQQPSTTIWEFTTVMQPRNWLMALKPAKWLPWTWLLCKSLSLRRY